MNKTTPQSPPGNPAELAKKIAETLALAPQEGLLVVNLGGAVLDPASLTDGAYHVLDVLRPNEGAAEVLTTRDGAAVTLEGVRWSGNQLAGAARKICAQSQLMREMAGLIGDGGAQDVVLISAERWDDVLAFLDRHGPLRQHRLIALICDMPVGLAPRDRLCGHFNAARAVLFDRRGGQAVLAAQDGARSTSPHLLQSLGAQFSDLTSEGGLITAHLSCNQELPAGTLVVAQQAGRQVAITQPQPMGQGTGAYKVEIELPRSVLFDTLAPDVTLHLGMTQLTQSQATASLPARRFVNAEELLGTDIRQGLLNQKRKEFGIILYSYTRTDGALLVVESLREQGVLPHVELWMDGDQGNYATKGKLEEAEARFRDFGVQVVRRHRGNLGFRKLILHSLYHMATTYERFVVLEDDCFPSEHAIVHFQKALAQYAEDPDVLTVYGSHFDLPQEQPLCPRFQSWGWASWSDKLLPVLHDLAYLYSLPEQAFLTWVKTVLTPDIVAAIDCIEGRKTTDTITRFFAWDEALCLLAALRGQTHAPTERRCIFNFGVGEDSTHFSDIELYRQPPFNMVLSDEVWEHFHEPESD